MSFLKNISSSITSFFSSLFRGVSNLIKAFFNKFKKPYHSSTLNFRGLLHSLAVAVAVFVVMYILQSFGIKDLAENEKIITLALCGGVAFAAMVICQFLLPIILKSFYDEHHWTGGKQLVQFILMSVLITLGINFFLDKHTTLDIEFPKEGLIIFVYSILPLIVLVFIQESMHDSRFKKKASDLNSDLKNKAVVNSENPLKVLVFKGSNEKLSLIPNQLIYAKIEGNTCEFYYQNPFGIDKSVMTITEKEVRDELIGHPQFIQFSANIILNTNAISKVNGSARGYEIAIAKVNEEVKVSGKFRKSLENL